MTLLFSVLLQIVIASCLRKFIGFKTILILSLFNFVRKVNPKQKEKIGIFVTYFGSKNV